MIKVRYSAVDGFRETRTFKTLKGAQAFAHKGVGEHPDFGSSYAISSDGVGKVTISGATIVELFPQKMAAAQALCDADWYAANETAIAAAVRDAYDVDDCPF